MKKYDYSDRDPLTAKIIEACYHVHTELGPGFTERIYLNALKIALAKLKLHCDTEKEFTVKYEEQSDRTHKGEENKCLKNSGKV